ncbi:hypothetical protein LTR85_003596 [Meristemomyces frigidus]|nr:hypothetical protein LTR85_003596 [Meristemomyces frigidus]
MEPRGIDWCSPWGSCPGKAVAERHLPDDMDVPAAATHEKHNHAERFLHEDGIHYDSAADYTEELDPTDESLRATPISADAAEGTWYCDKPGCKLDEHLKADFHPGSPLPPLPFTPPKYALDDPDTGEQAGETERSQPLAEMALEKDAGLRREKRQSYPALPLDVPKPGLWKRRCHLYGAKGAACMVNADSKDENGHTASHSPDDTLEKRAEEAATSIADLDRRSTDRVPNVGTTEGRPALPGQKKKDCDIHWTSDKFCTDDKRDDDMPDNDNGAPIKRDVHIPDEDQGRIFQGAKEHVVRNLDERPLQRTDGLPAAIMYQPGGEEPSKGRWSAGNRFTLGDVPVYREKARPLGKGDVAEKAMLDEQVIRDLEKASQRTD